MTLQEQVNRNVVLLAAAAGTNPSAISLRMGKSRAWLHAKLAGRNAWAVEDVEAIAAVLGVEASTMMTTDWWPDVLRACRDSNPKPSGSCFRTLAVAA
jgi:cyanate lyase